MLICIEAFCTHGLMGLTDESSVTADWSEPLGLY